MSDPVGRRSDEEIRDDLHSVNAYEARLINAPRACNRLLDDVETLLSDVAAQAERIAELERDDVDREMRQQSALAELRDAFLKASADRDAAQARADELGAALAELVRLKDGPRDDAYRAAKEAAWSAARAALTPPDTQPEPQR